MLSPWFLVVRGHPDELQLIAERLPLPEYTLRVEPDSEDWRLRVTGSNRSSDPGAVGPQLEAYLATLVESVAATLHRRLAISPGGLGRSKADGGWDQWVGIPTIHNPASVISPAVLAHGAPNPPDPVALGFRVAQSSEPLRRAAHFLNANRDWFNLYKVFEIIDQETEFGKGAILREGWGTPDDVSAFQAGANPYGASGDGARHGIFAKPKGDFMTLHEGEECVRKLFDRYVRKLAAVQGTAP